MGKYESLERIKEVWKSEDMPLGQKAAQISEEFYSSGLDFATTAAFINATPSELDALLEIGGFEDETLDRISRINPPKTSWTMLSNATEEEVDHALDMLERHGRETSGDTARTSITEYVYFAMIEVAEPSVEQKVGNLSGRTIKLMREKAEHFEGAISAKEVTFLKSCASRKGSGRSLTPRQLSWLISICNRLAERGIISRNSIDGDQEMCDEVLDALGL